MNECDKDAAFVEQLLARMTVTEKVGQLNQRLYGWEAYERQGDGIRLTDKFKEEVGRYGGMGALYGLFRADPWSGMTFETGIDTTRMARAANQVQRYVVENTRLGIPLLMVADSPHGNMALGAYLLPVNLAAGCAFDPALLGRANALCAAQLREAGVHITLLAGLDMLREPRWGRSEECFGEDPYLASRMTEAAVRGCQGDSSGRLDRDKLAVVIKHFCAQGACEGGVNTAPANIGERELREIHLPPMQGAIRAGVMGCMAAYNEIDGIPCHGNPRLLNGLLRGELGFDGIVMADGRAVDRLIALTGDTVRAGAMALKSGVDLSLWDDGFTLLEQAVTAGYVQEEDLDRAVRRILLLKYRLGLFDNPYVEEKDTTYHLVDGAPDPALELAQESVVLLKNEGAVLPLSKGVKRVAVIGPNADNLYNQLGDYTPPYDPARGRTLLQGIRETVPGAEVVYARGCGIRSGEEAELEEAVELARGAEVIVLALGGSSTRDFNVLFDNRGAAVGGQAEMDCGEGVDLADITISPIQRELFRRLRRIGVPLVTVLIQGRPHALAEINDQTDGLLAAFYPGPMGGRALAQILFGDIAPSGRLSVSIPKSPAQLPIAYNLRDSSNQDTYVDMDHEPLYPFGYGLTYTTFAYSGLEADRASISMRELDEGAAITLRVDVRNSGKTAATAVPQLYIRRMTGSVVPRRRELRGFQRLRLEPGETRAAVFTLAKEELERFTAEGHCQTEAGAVRVFCGESSRAEAFVDLAITP